MNALTVTRAKKDLETLIAQIVADSEPTIISTDAGDSVVLIPLVQWGANS